MMHSHSMQRLQISCADRVSAVCGDPGSNNDLGMFRSQRLKCSNKNSSVQPIQGTFSDLCGDDGHHVAIRLVGWIHNDPVLNCNDLPGICLHFIESVKLLDAIGPQELVIGATG